MRRRLSQPVLSEKVLTLEIKVEEETKPPASSAKILLLEDRDDFREVIREYLVNDGYQVTPANSGVEGLREIMNGAFDLIICDMLMPKMGGEMFYWAVTRVRPGTRDRFIFFTGHMNNPAIEFFFRRVNARVLFKPFPLESLTAAIHEVLQKAR